jgi:hypothetical protein
MIGSGLLQRPISGRRRAGPKASSQAVQQGAHGDRALLERHAYALALQGFDAEPAEVLADRVEDLAYRDQQLVGFPRLAVLESGVDRHVAAVAEPVAADVVAEGIAVILGVCFNRSLGLTAGVAHGRASTPAGGILALKPAVSFHPLVVVETVVGLERHDCV